MNKLVGEVLRVSSWDGCFIVGIVIAAKDLGKGQVEVVLEAGKLKLRHTLVADLKSLQAAG